MIVVIAILAAISIVAYNGIQTRANNTQTIDATKQFIRAYSMYATDHGDYPNITGCLGAGYPSDRCLSMNGAQCWGTGGASVNATLHTALAPYLGGSIPSPSMQRAGCADTAYVGVYASYQSASKTVVIYMILRDDQSCPPMSPNVSSVGENFQDAATRCTYILAAM